MNSVLLFSTLLVLPFSSVTSYNWTNGVIDEKVEGKSGSDLQIGYLDMFRSKDKSIQNLLSFQAAVSKETFWPDGVKVGYVVVNVPDSTEESHVNVIMETLRRYPKIVSFIGFVSSSSDVIQSASFLTAVRIPTFTCSSSIKIDELLKVDNHEYMTRITSIRSAQMSGTIPSILDELGVNIVSIFFDRIKELEFSKLNQWLHDHREKRVDVEYQKLIDGNSTVDRKTILDHVTGKDRRQDEKDRIRTIIFLVSGNSLQMILADLAAHSEELPKVVFVTDSSGCRNTLSFQSAVQQLTSKKVVMFRLCQTGFDAPEVMDYIKNYKLYTREDGKLNSSSKVIEDWYINVKKQKPCIVGEDKDCKSVEELCLENPPSSRYNHRIYYTARKVLKSLKNITKDQVDEIRSRNYEDILFNSSSVGHLIYEGFKKNNVDLPEGSTCLRYANKTMVNFYEVQFDARGNYNYNSTVWTSGKNNTMFEDFMRDIKSEITTSSDQYFSCSRHCQEGNRTVVDRTFHNCWKCVPCERNTYTENGSWSSCKDCDSISKKTFLWVNKEKTKCDQPAGSVDFGTNSGKAIWIIALLNIAILIFTIVIYIKYWKSKVIISCGRELSCIMFCGILIGHIEALLIAVEPTATICTLIQVVSHFLMMLTVCPLLVKTFRIWMVFKFSVKMGKKIHKYVNQWATMVQCIILMLPQLVFLLFAVFLSESYKFRFTVNYEEETLDNPIVVTKSCGPKNFTLMLTSIVYTGFLLLISSVLGWDCRKLPDNFKESMYIFLSSLISFLLIAVYVPAMLNMAGFTQVSLLAGVITFISVTLNLVIFMPKVYVVLFVPLIKQKAMFRSNHKSSSVHNEVTGEERSGINGEVDV